MFSPKNFLACTLTDLSLLFEDLCLRLELSTTNIFRINLKSWKQKGAATHGTFFSYDGEQRVGRDGPVIGTCPAVHGFHHRLCRKLAFHKPGATFKCFKRGSCFDRYHRVARCPLVTDLGHLANVLDKYFFFKHMQR